MALKGCRVTQRLLADLMGTGTSTISDNIQKFWDWDLFNENEHKKDLKDFNNLSDTSDKRRKFSDGRPAKYYSFDVLIQLGITFKSKNARNFQKELRDLLKKLYTGKKTIIEPNTVMARIFGMHITVFGEKSMLVK